MSVFVVSYDIVEEGSSKSQQKAGNDIRDALKRLGGRHVLLSVWTLDGNLGGRSPTAAQLRDYLKQYIRGVDRLLVAKAVDIACTQAVLNQPHRPS